MYCNMILLSLRDRNNCAFFVRSGHIALDWYVYGSGQFAYLWSGMSSKDEIFNGTMSLHFNDIEGSGKYFFDRFFPISLRCLVR